MLTPFLQNYFMVDTANEVDNELIRDHYRAAKNVVLHPDRFPQVDRDNAQRLAAELMTYAPSVCMGNFVSTFH